MILDASAGGSLKNRDEAEARELVESMAQNEYRATNDRGAKKKGGVLELDTQTALLAQQKLMTSQMEAMMKLLAVTTQFSEEEESLGARARGELGIRDLRRVFFESRFTGFVVFDVESSVKLRSDCDTGKRGFICI
ncbi:unnamed protein product [Trifolium pratense]|uniref:Uncharacterized protein n=1 Tax=Trifolium pratense TaxID=57577 RepID=A0ACB0K7F0_TRIPR|nr:unnamed protein product [Trifolium pratense]